MAKPLTPAQREELGAKAYELSLRGKSFRTIGEEIGVHHSTAGRLIKQQAQLRRVERKDTVHSLLDGLDAAIAEAYERLDAIPKNSASPGPASLLNAINSLQRSKIDLLGYKAPTRSQSWVHHTRSSDHLDKLSQEELQQYLELLYRLFPDLDGGGELGDEEAAVEVIPELEPYRNGKDKRSGRG